MLLRRDRSHLPGGRFVYGFCSVMVSIVMVFNLQLPGGDASLSKWAPLRGEVILFGHILWRAISYYCVINPPKSYRRVSNVKAGYFIKLLC